MASTITAGNATNGLAMSSDSTGILNIKTGTGTGTNAITIDASQNVSIPKGVGGTPAFSAYLATNQSIANNTNTKVTINTEDFDTASCFDTSTNRFTPNVAGYYQINVSGYLVGSAVNGYIQGYIFKNGSAFKTTLFPYTSNNGIGGVSLSTVISMNGTTDYVEFYVYQVTGASQNLIGGQPSTVFSGALVRAA